MKKNKKNKVLYTGTENKFKKSRGIFETIESIGSGYFSMPLQLARVHFVTMIVGSIPNIYELLFSSWGGVGNKCMGVSPDQAQIVTLCPFAGRTVNFNHGFNQHLESASANMAMTSKTSKGATKGFSGPFALLSTFRTAQCRRVRKRVTNMNNVFETDVSQHHYPPHSSPLPASPSSSSRSARLIYRLRLIGCLMRIFSSPFYNIKTTCRGWLPFIPLVFLLRPKYI